jgi:uncharacterized protein (TIGR03089 family)
MDRIAGSPGDTVESLRAVAIAVDPAQPVLTWYDDDTGERVELSGVTLDNWVAKTANLVVDGCGLGPGDRATVALPPHWQTAAVLLGCWAAGLAVATAPTGDWSADVIFAAAPEAAAAADRFFLGMAPMGMPARDVPAGWVDYIAEVRRHGDRFTPSRAVRPDSAAAPDLSHAALVARARERAAALRIAGGRVLIGADAHPDPVDWLLAPLAAGASIVLCGHLDPQRLAARVEAERVDTVLA